ncbi:MAG: Ig-like domain-containing protein [Ruminococcus sp.]|nr:MAG: Ig-like domain-containing protein [Ruminococcus sp.]
MESPIFKDAPEELVVPVFKRDTESLYERANERAGSAAILSNKFGIYNGDTYITSSRAHTLNRYDKTYSEILSTRDYVHAYGIKGYYPEAANWIFPKGYNDTNQAALTYDPSVENYGFMMNLPIRYDVKKIILKPLLEGKFTADNPIDTSNGESLSEAIKSALTFTTENMDYSNMPTELLYGNTSYNKTNVEEPEGETVYAPASDDFDIITGNMTYDEKTGLQKVTVTFVLTEKGEEAYELSASDNAGISATVYVKAAMESYSFSKESVSVSENASEKLDLSRYLEVSPTGTDASSVKYYSDNPEIATVDESTGAVTPVAPGSAKIYARGNYRRRAGPQGLHHC